MNQVAEFGLEIAVIPPSALAQADTAPSTLAELMSIVAEESTKYSPMLATAARRFTDFVGREPADIAISELVRQKKAFATYLRGNRYKPASVKSYGNYLKMLVARAKDAGWQFRKPAMSTEWVDLHQKATKAGLRALIEHLSALNLKPEEVDEDDLKRWRELRMSEGMSASYLFRACSMLRTAVQARYTNSRLMRRVSRYALPLSAMHPALRSEILEIVSWKTSEFQPDRPASARIREISGELLVRIFGHLLGWAQNIAGHGPYESIASLLNQRTLVQYVSWAINTRKVKGKTLSSRLGMLFAAIRYNPSYSTLDLSWFDALLNSLPLEERSRIDARKAPKILSYSAAEEIPQKIRGDRLRNRSATPLRGAISVRDELLMLWLLILPWRQRNIRECRIGGENPNVFKSRVSPLTSITRPAWVAAVETTSPDAEFWRFRFSASETKTGNEIHAFLPKELAALLEEYLSGPRSVLLNGRKDLGCLFLSDRGKPMASGQMTCRVRGLAMRYTGVAVTPHLYRDIVAYEWLRWHPQDYLTLSKILWHRNINTTIGIYASQFNGSTGVAMMDDWRGIRTAKN
jgi:hypothetical protein